LVTLIAAPTFAPTRERGSDVAGELLIRL